MHINISIAIVLQRKVAIRGNSSLSNRNMEKKMKRLKGRTMYAPNNVSLTAN